MQKNAFRLCTNQQTANWRWCLFSEPKTKINPDQVTDLLLNWCKKACRFFSFLRGSLSLKKPLEMVLCTAEYLGFFSLTWNLLFSHFSNRVLAKIYESIFFLLSAKKKITPPQSPFSLPKSQKRTPCLVWFGAKQLKVYSEEEKTVEMQSLWRV